MGSRPYVPGKYFSGVPCPKGHLADRLIYNKQCVECKKLTDRTSNKKASRKYQLSKHYNLTEVEFKELKIKQQNKCAICTDELGEGHRTQIDHCHKTGDVRGLLCKRCNMMLGNARDDITILENAIRYLTRSKDGKSINHIQICVN